MIGVQLVMAGYQLPARYPWHRWKDMFLMLVPVLAIMWFCTTGCIKLMVPKMTTLTAMVIASCVTSTDPVLSQTIAKGPFADKYVPRALRELISAAAGSNDGFGYPPLLLATYLIRHAPEEDVIFKPGARLEDRAPTVGRLGGGPGKAFEIWIVEGWLYFIFVGAIVGAVLGIASMYAVTFSLKRCALSPPRSFFGCTKADIASRKWIHNESLLLFPTALGLFTLGVCGLTGLDDLLACFCAGVALNWNGIYLQESLTRHDEVNSSIDILLNFGGFMYIGAIMPWSEFSSTITGITPGRLMTLALMVLLVRRIPAMLLVYKAMPKSVTSWREALFMGYFGPIGIGAVAYVEHARHLYPKIDYAQTHEEEDLLRAMVPVVYFLVLFSILVHSLSIPALELIYKWRGVEPITEIAPVVENRMSVTEALPANSHLGVGGSVVRHNRFSQAIVSPVISRGVVVERDLESGLAGSRNVSVSTPVLKGKKGPETTVFTLDDDSEDTHDVEDFEKEGRRIQFVG